ncbi:MAG: DMT family transporter [Rhodospirillales bacterium]
MDAQNPRGLNRGDRAILVSALFWGTIWWPVRSVYAADAESGGALAMMLSYLIAAAVILPFTLRSAGVIKVHWKRWTALGVFAAGGYVLYAEAMLTGHVARMLILFYLLPVWTTVLERVLLGWRITRARSAALVLGLSGLLVIVGPDALSGGVTTADAVALSSGLVFSGAMVLISRTPELPSSAKAGAAFLFMPPMFLLACLLPGGSVMPGGAGIAAVSGEAWMWIMLHAAVWLAPAFWLSIYGAGLTTPGRACIFFMAEVLTGVLSAALFAGEVITVYEAIGAFLVVSAGVAEVMWPSGKPAGKPADG